MGSYSQLTYHVVFSTKYRHPSIKDELKQELYEYIGGTLRAKKGQLIEIGGVEDHVHVRAKQLLAASSLPNCPTLAAVLESFVDIIRDMTFCFANASLQMDRNEQLIEGEGYEPLSGKLAIAYFQSAEYSVHLWTPSVSTSETKKSITRR